MSGKVARRYARALFDAVPPSDFDATQAVLDTFADMWVSSSELQLALLNPAFPEHEREAALTSVVAGISGEPSRYVSPTLVIMLRNHRLEDIGEVRTLFRTLVSTFRRSLDMTITSAHTLDANEQSAIQAELERGCGAPVRVTWKVDSALIGGMRIESGDKVIERSVQGALLRAREEFIHAC